MVDTVNCLYNNQNTTLIDIYSQDLGSCLDLKNTNNATVRDFVVYSCYSHLTACGFKIYYEQQKGGTNNQVFL